ncbi:hypothetical protein DPMN_019171 [Dreissena polymorpha]|uniref:Uncharacterized protein n=1 Tax=Dreissena polymorpha TaxID=45954 RepID=A0A9D4NHW0_DREPO|nr:hypothetical protein DPMN_019171 [Dreissena polymorpha]
MVSPHRSFVYIPYGGHLGFLELVDPGRFALVGRSILGRVDLDAESTKEDQRSFGIIPVRAFTKNGRIFGS